MMNQRSGIDGKNYAISLQNMTVTLAGNNPFTLVVDRLVLDDGMVTAIVGESGSGKSVLAKALVGFLTSARYSGKIVYKGHNILGEWDNTVIGKEIFYLPQDPDASFNPALTIKTQLCEVLEYQYALKTREALMLVKEALCLYGFSEVDRILDAVPYMLSGGMKQRLLCCMAYILRPRWIIADEPTKGIDAILRRQTVSLLRSLKEQGSSLLLITHDLEVATALCDRMLIMKKGKIAADGEPSQLIECITDPEVKAFFANQMSLLVQ